MTSTDRLESVIRGFEELSSTEKHFDLTWHSMGGVFGDEPFCAERRRAIARLRLPFDFRRPELDYTLGLDPVTVPIDCRKTDRFLELAAMAVYKLPNEYLQALDSISGELNDRPEFLWITHLFCMYADPICYQVGDEYRYHREVTVYKPIIKSITALCELRHDRITVVNTQDQESRPNGTPSRTRTNKPKGDLISSALIIHHKYEKGSVLEWRAIGNNELASMANVTRSTASKFFKKWFGSHQEYEYACSRQERLIVVLTQLNGESVIRTYGSDSENGESDD